MRPVVLVLCLLSGGALLRCTPAPRAQGNFGQAPPLRLRHPRRHPASQALLRQFAAAHARADSVVRLAFPDPRVCQSLRTDYRFAYLDHEVAVTDPLPGPARAYQFYYRLLHRGDTIGPAVVSIGPDLRIYPSALAELVAYQHFSTGALTISRQQALAIGTGAGVTHPRTPVPFCVGGFWNDTLRSLDQARAYYRRVAITPYSCYWRVESNCNGCVNVRVDAINGEVFGRSTVMFNY